MVQITQHRKSFVIILSIIIAFILRVTNLSFEELWYDELQSVTHAFLSLTKFVKIDMHTKALNQKDARGKYEYLQKIAPELIKRAKLGYIASIIGVTQETLSRIRKI